MRGMGLEVDRPMIPTALELSDNEELLSDPQAHPVKVCDDARLEEASPIELGLGNIETYRR